MKASVQLAEGITVVAQGDDVFVEMRDASGKVFAVAGLTLEAAAQFNETVTAVCVEALNARHAEMAQSLPKPGVLH